MNITGAMRGRRLPTLCVAVLAFEISVVLPAQAQTSGVPDAGQILRELQRPVAPAERPAPTLNLPTEAGADTAAVDGVSFVVSQIRIEGNQSIASSEFDPMVSGLLGRSIGLSDLRDATRRMTAFYRSRGYVLARAYLPPQEVKDGVLSILVLEGTLSQIRVDNTSSLADAQLEAIVRAQATTGAAVEERRLDRALLLLSDLPGAGAVDGNLRPGEQVGSSELIVRVGPAPTVKGDVTLDNQGNRYTGQNRLSGHVVVNNPIGIADRFDLRATVSDEHLWYGRLAYDAPIGANGLRLGGQLQQSRYVLSKEFADLGATGSAQSSGLIASYPVLRGLPASVWLSAAVEHRRLKDDNAAASIESRKEANVTTIEVRGDMVDSVLGPASRIDWSFGATAGSLQIRSPELQAADEAGPRTEGGYSKWQYGFRMLKSIRPDTQLMLAVNGQQANDNLDSSEKFSLGGAYGVRAYPQGEGSGDNGYVATAEVRRTLTGFLRVAAFYDLGHVRVNRRPYAAGEETQTLGGYGINLQGAVEGFTLGVTAAWREGRAALTAPDRKLRWRTVATWRF